MGQRGDRQRCDSYTFNEFPRTAIKPPRSVTDRGCAVFGDDGKKNIIYPRGLGGERGKWRRGGGGVRGGQEQEPESVQQL